MRRNTSILALVYLVLATNVSTAVLINHQGRLTNNAGEPVIDGPYPMTFTIYDAPTAGMALWSSGVRSVNVSGGLFSYLLGENVSLPHQLFATDSSLWLGVRLDLDPEITPRIRLVSTPKSAVSASVSGDIRTFRGRLLLYDNAAGIIVDSGIVIESKASALDHNGHVTILKISNGGLDTTIQVGIFGDPDFARVVVGDGKPDSGVVIESKASAIDHNGHVTILKISNGNLDTTIQVGIFGDPDFARVVVGDDKPDSGVVIESKASALDHNGHVTILKISNGGLDTTSMVGLFGDPDFARVVVGNGNSRDSGVVIESKTSSLDHHGHVTILKIANGGIDTTKFIDIRGDVKKSSMRLNGGIGTTGMAGGSILMVADTGATGGKIGINTLTPAHELDVVGTICATGGMCTPSDRRLKKNIEPLQGALSMIESLEPVSYNWRTEEYPDRHFSSETQIGFIAQEVKKILPELVSQGSDGMYALDYMHLTPALVGAIKAQQKQLDAQQAQIEELKNMLKTLTTTTKPAMNLTSANK